MTKILGKKAERKELAKESMRDSTHNHRRQISQLNASENLTEYPKYDKGGTVREITIMYLMLTITNSPTKVSVVQ